MEAVSGISTFIDVLANDSDPDRDSLTITAATEPVNGSVSIQSGKVNYCSKPGYIGSDFFTYTISDGELQAQAKVVVTVVNQANRPPVAEGDFAIISIGRSTSIDVLANDQDEDGDELSIIDVQDASGFTIDVSADGKSLMCTPRPGQVLESTGGYTISDGRGGTVTTHITCRLRVERQIIMQCLPNCVWEILTPALADISGCSASNTQTVRTVRDRDTHLKACPTSTN